MGVGGGGVEVEGAGATQYNLSYHFNSTNFTGINFRSSYLNSSHGIHFHLVFYYNYVKKFAFLFSPEFAASR